MASAALIVGVALLADLSPHVDQDFFFASDDPARRADARISEIFPGADGAQVIVMASGDPDSAPYLERLGHLSDELARLADVHEVRSLTRGPKSAKRAEKSPLWQRLVGGEDGRSSLILATLAPDAGPAAIEAIEALVARHQGPGFRLHVSGVPYVVELIRRHLERDMVVFSLAAIVIFGSIVSVLFRSFAILAGTLCACLSASAATLLAADLAGLEIGVLTANLVTIVFILTLHHIIYMTFAWREAHAREASGADATEHALRETLVPSVWVMLTTTIGFASLLLADAQPLRELGLSGAMGAVLGFIAAHVVHPSFLQLAREPSAGALKRRWVRLLERLHLRWPHGLSLRRDRARTRADDEQGARLHGWAVAAIAGIAIALATGVSRLERDPSLLSYFARGGEIRAGLEQIDRNGGSSPLRLVVRDATGERLDRKRTYKRMQALHAAFEARPEVGVVISLPLIMAEAKGTFLGRFFTHRFLLERLERPKHGSIARRFVTEDRRRALFILRMREGLGHHDRLATIEELRGIAAAHGFEVVLSGGLYAMQGQIASAVVSSLVTGVGQLMACFFVIALAVARSLRWALALAATLALVPAIVLGTLGYLRVPLDIISAPAINVALGMAIDDMLHMTATALALRRAGAEPAAAWVTARSRSWRPLFGTASIVSTGFAILVLSDFPPTQRFGLAVMGGALIDVVACLVVLPWLAVASERIWPRGSRQPALAVEPASW